MTQGWGGVLGALGFCVLKFVERVANVFGNCNVDVAIFVVPVQLEAKEFGTCPVFRFTVKGAERVPKVLCIFFFNILYIKVIDNERKDDVPGFVALKRWCVLDGGVAKLS